MTEASPNTGRGRQGDWRVFFWPAFIVALLAGQILLILIMVYVAVSDDSFAVEPDYYRKGLHWNEIAAQRRRNEQLGWRVAVSLGDEASVLSQRQLRCELIDRQGRPLDGAAVDMLAFPHSRGGERTTATLKPLGQGVYAADLRFLRQGWWEFRFAVRRGPDTFTAVCLREVYPPGESRPWRR